MARIRMITRTVVSTVFTVMAVNQSTMAVESVEVSIPSADSMTESKQVEAVKSNMPEGYLFVQITGKQEQETLYGMTEEEFIRLAKMLPPRGSKTEE